MSCIQAVTIDRVLTLPTVNNQGWLDMGTIETNAPTQYWPVTISELEFDSMAQGVQQVLTVEQISIEETASSSANKKRNALAVYLYTDAAPTAPTLGAVYNPSALNLLGVFNVPSGAATPADPFNGYRRVSDTVDIATIKPQEKVVVGTTAASSTIWAVVLFQGASPSQYIAGVGLRLKLFIRPHAL